MEIQNILPIQLIHLKFGLVFLQFLLTMFGHIYHHQGIIRHNISFVLLEGPENIRFALVVGSSDKPWLLKPRSQVGWQFFLCCHDLDFFSNESLQAISPRDLGYHIASNVSLSPDDQVQLSNSGQQLTNEADELSMARSECKMLNS